MGLIDEWFFVMETCKKAGAVRVYRGTFMPRAEFGMKHTEKERKSSATQSKLMLLCAAHF